MDTNDSKTPAPLPFAGWQAMSPGQAAREVHQRVAALPDRLRRAALAHLSAETAIAGELAAAPVGAPLRGVPYLLKDLFDAAGLPTRAGSTFLARVRPTPGDGAVVRRLRECGAALAGKTHLVEFASGLTGENPHYGDCPHPRFPDRLSGGSSSGSAALVAAGITPLAIGTDTGGSVRVPAAFCGLYGFRLTPGDDLIRDAFPLSPTMDTAGWFTAHAADMQTALRALVGAPGTSPRAPRGCFLAGRALLPEIDPAIDAAGETTARRWCEPADESTRTALLAAWQNSVDAYLTIGMSEAHAVHRHWLAPYHEHYDPVIWQRFTDAGHFTAEKLATARSTLEAIRDSWREFFKTYDFLALPGAPFPALHKAECTPEARRAIIRLTAPASLGGLPCLTLPVPLSSGLSAGVQVIVPSADSFVIDWLLRQHA
jgi:amidase/aspartyl-tRNA(Asn)/glutamyl-tRNA(Gln) amidotransferase subunit A